MTKDTITILINKVPYYYSTTNTSGTPIQLPFGGTNVTVSKITNFITGYSNPNNYKIELPKTIQNVIEAKLISSIFTNTMQIFRNNVGDTNTNLYWQNMYDGDVIYNISIPAGNYTTTELCQLLQTTISTIPRKYPQSASGNTTYTNMNHVTVSIDAKTNIVAFNAYDQAYLTNPIIDISPIILPDTVASAPQYTLTILHYNHKLQVGDVVIFSGLVSTADIPENILNGPQTVTTIANANQYQFIIKNFNLDNGSRTIKYGGSSCQVAAPTMFRLLFTTDDTMGKELGFRNVGLPTSITQFGISVTNGQAYQNEPTSVDQFGNTTVYDRSGKSVILRSNALRLRGHDYFLIVLREFSNVITTINNNLLVNSFAKINLSNEPGKILYDTFVSTPVVLYEPIDLSELNIALYAPSGVPYDCNDIDHSFVIEVTAIDLLPKDVGLVTGSSRF